MLYANAVGLHLNEVWLTSSCVEVVTFSVIGFDIVQCLLDSHQLIFVNLLVRQFGFILLCGLVAFGHAPAWIHVAQCTDSSVAATSETGCKHCCCNHVKSDKSEQKSESHDEGSESCAICQSLASATGVITRLGSDICFKFCVEITRTPERFLVESNPLSVARPRGPPVLV